MAEKTYVKTTWSALRDGEEVRLTNSKGDTIHGVFHAAGRYIRSSAGELGLDIVGFYHIEVVEKPKRTLPVLPGAYTEDGKDPNYTTIYLRSKHGTWMTDNDGEAEGWVTLEEPEKDLPDNLVHFSPDSEVLDYKARVERAKTFVQGYHNSAPESYINALLAILDGHSDG